MFMPRPRTRRTLALLALALTLFAALPCAALAGNGSCCGTAPKCGDGSESPCAQLAATPCCGSKGAALELAVAAKIYEAPTLCALSPGAFPAAIQRIAGFVPPAARSSDIALRSVILRL
jgi:hypothetical protein